MGYTFAPVTDFEKLLAPLEKLYGREKAPRQLERYRGLVRGLEETFGIRIPEKELRSFVTISDLADYLSARVG